MILAPSEFDVKLAEHYRSDYLWEFWSYKQQERTVLIVV